MRRPGVMGAPGRVLVRDGRRRCVAEIRTNPAPIEAQRENLAYVCAGLRAAGVEFFRVRGHDDLGSAVAVAESDRARVLAALRASAARSTFIYLVIRGAKVPDCGPDSPLARGTRSPTSG